MFKIDPGLPDLKTQTIAAKSQLRALNAVMLAIGLIALWARYELHQSRTLILSLGSVLLLVSVSNGIA